MFPPILNIPDLLSWCHSSLRLDNFHFDFELIELSHLFGLSFPHFFSVELLTRLFRRRLWSWRHWDPSGSQSQLIPLLHLETESLSRARFRHLELTHVLWDKSCYNVDSVDRVQTTCCRLILAGVFLCSHFHW